MNIHELLTEETIFLPLETGTKDTIITQMTAGLKLSGSVTDAEQYVRDVLIREATGSTGIGFGVAIPHGKSVGVAKPGLALARLSEPTDWDSLDGTPVSIVFLIAVPQENVGNEHLKILVALSRKLIHDEFRESLLNAGSKQELIDILKNM
ncbi:PTS sugar transporter subunit IIA [Paenibacillus sp. 19GGS1-52]|uniref:PTS sugar transporter subunit IIA n=1 Tax=Paenibacillus sp. 19GGS1-52 TaxID=2758563 RepID=UPI001EFA5BEC|nr:fructose PTS transporter subunit IIA [Paenibacillus sp. 19GGS1-52]ULO09080.1 PTS sugar transporter subunit IIA [Paenibacillus sp. 19GGS1-52]